MTEEQLKETIISGYNKRRSAGFRMKVNFTREELQDLNALVSKEDYIIEKVMKQLRPDTADMDRSEIECLQGNIPDGILEQIESIEIESTISEETMAPQIIVVLRLLPSFHMSNILPI